MPPAQIMSSIEPPTHEYRGRLAPSPTGHLHLGHARTFWVAQHRAWARGGSLILRNEDLDPDRCKAGFVVDLLEDLRWFGFEWSEGPDRGGPFGPYTQSERRRFYVEAFETLWLSGLVYPCRCSRRDVLQCAQAPHAADEEPLYPGTCRDWPDLREQALPWRPGLEVRPRNADAPRFNWRLRVPDGEAVTAVKRSFHGPRAILVASVTSLTSPLLPGLMLGCAMTLAARAATTPAC